MDLFKHYDLLPNTVMAIIEKYSENDTDPYKNCREMEAELKPLGYTFEWGLDGQPFNLQKINRKYYTDTSKDREGNKLFILSICEDDSEIGNEIFYSQDQLDEYIDENEIEIEIS